MPSAHAAVALGSNLGDRGAILDAAAEALRRLPGVVDFRISGYHETAPVGGPAGQGAFLNAAAAFVYDGSPEGLHDELRRIEQAAGRERRVRWGERTLDLDLLLFGDLRIDLPELTVPHPRMSVRRFVLAPLAEVAPDLVDPITGRTAAESLSNLDRTPHIVGLVGSAADLVFILAAEVPEGWQVVALWDGPLPQPPPTFLAEPGSEYERRFAGHGIPILPLGDLTGEEAVREVVAACRAAM